MQMLKHFAVYDLENGAVVRVGRSSSERALDLVRSRLQPGQGLYEGEVDPKTQYLPGGLPWPKPETVVVVTPAAVKQWAGRLLSYTDWYVTRQAETGTPIPEDILAYRQAVRASSNELEVMDPIPTDFQEPKYWLAHL